MVIMVLGRILQGIGLSAPRTITVAMIRDLYRGNYMARIMSFVSVFFILVPMIAPIMGKTILDHYNWQAIFYIQLIITALLCIWFYKRQEETLKPIHRVQYTSGLFISGLKEILKHPTTIGYTFIGGLVVGAFLGYLSLSQQIFVQQYQLKEEFPYIFGLLAFSTGIAIFINGTLVLKYGMKNLVAIALCLYLTISSVYSILFYNTQNPDVVVLLSFFILQFFAFGLIFGNIQAMAMEPIGHIAGVGAAITGFISTTMAVSISTVIGRFVSGTVLPLFIGFMICGLLSLCILLYLRISTRTLRFYIPFKK